MPESTATSTATDNQDSNSNVDKTVESQEPLPNAPQQSSDTPTMPSADSQPHEDRKAVTTEERKPLQVPETVHINITAGNLKDYVGPPVYYRDRLYTTAPPSGVSTGLGYLGNGSGAVMPIEAAVGTKSPIFVFFLTFLLEYAREGIITAHRKTRRSHPRKCTDRIKLGEEQRIRARNYRHAHRSILERNRRSFAHARR